MLYNKAELVKHDFFDGPWKPQREKSRENLLKTGNAAELQQSARQKKKMVSSRFSLRFYRDVFLLHCGFDQLLALYITTSR